MSDDLISRSAFIKFVREHCKDSLADLWCELIMMQPTAYDVGKVVAQLEEYIKESNNVDYNRAMIEAIEVIRKGGVNENR